MLTIFSALSLHRTRRLASLRRSVYVALVAVEMLWSGADGSFVRSARHTPSREEKGRRAHWCHRRGTLGVGDHDGVGSLTVLLRRLQQRRAGGA